MFKVKKVIKQLTPRIQQVEFEDDTGIIAMFIPKMSLKKLQPKEKKSKNTAKEK